MECVGSGAELLVPAVSDVIFKYTWLIEKYAKRIKKKEFHDSPSFDYNVNDIKTCWNLSVRYWKGPEGRRLTNPVVLCLNLLSCSVEEPRQVKIRFQFGVFNAEVKQWELCNVSRTVLNLQTSKDMLSVGHRDLSILGRHEQPGGDVAVFVKLQLIHTETEKNSLSQDMARLLKDGSGSDIVVTCDGGQEFAAHTNILSARSSVLAMMIYRQDDRTRLDLEGVTGEVLQELLRYIYTDHVDNSDTLAPLLIATGERFGLPGLKVLCERTLTETITQENVASLLLLADQFGCDQLKRAALAYCEENATGIHKSLAWKVMEMVNPNLFLEACEVGLGSSASSNLDSIHSDNDLVGL